MKLIRGFTLIEALVVMSLIAGFTWVGVANFQRTSRKVASEAAVERLRQAFFLARTNALAGKKENCLATATNLCNGPDGQCKTADDLVLNGWGVAVDTVNKTFTVDGFCGANINFTSNDSERLGGNITITVSPSSTTRVTFQPLGNGVVTVPPLSPAISEVVYTISDSEFGINSQIRVSKRGEIQ